VAVNLATIYSQRGENERAEGILRKVIQVDPGYWVARNNLGVNLSAQGKVAEAEKLYDSVRKPTAEERENFPNTWAAALQLARAAHDRCEDDSALAIMNRARRDYPDSWPLLSFQAELLRQTRGPSKALPLIRRFLQEHWWHSQALIASGRLYCEMGNVAEAGSAWRWASWLDVHDVSALNLVAQMNLRLGRFNEAMEFQCRALAREPDQPSQYLGLADILQKMGRAQEARTTLAKVSKMKAIAAASVD
jgi:Flp pilus assembly protein TadD